MYLQKSGGGGLLPLGPSVPTALYVVTFDEKPLRFAQHHLDGEEYKISHRPWLLYVFLN